VRLPFYSLLQEASGRMITEVFQEIRALEMPRNIAGTFGLEDGSWSLQLLRRYVTREGTLIASFNWHRADQFVYRMNLLRRSAADAGGS
jgi:DNA-binding GntR family transcriptional regulator